MMKQEFRVVRNQYEHGDPRKIQVVINPRGPPGFTGSDSLTSIHIYIHSYIYTLR